LFLRLKLPADKVLIPGVALEADALDKMQLRSLWDAYMPRLAHGQREAHRLAGPEIAGG